LQKVIANKGLSSIEFIDVNKYNNYIRARNTRTEMDDGRIACRPLVSHVEYLPCALLTLEKMMGRTDGRTDDRPMHYAYS